MSKKRKNRDQDGVYRRKDSPYWWASYSNASGKRTRRSTGATHRKEAEVIHAKWKLETHQERHWEVQPPRSFDELMLQYLNETMHLKRTGPRRITVAARNLYAEFSGRDISDIKMHDVRTYVRKRRMSGLAASTVNKEVGLFSAAVNYARREWGWEINNPAQGCREREPEGRVRWITRAESVKLLQIAGAEPRALHLASFIELALHTGCRKGELLELEWRRVDLKRGLFFLEAQHTKTSRRRSVPLNKNARAALIEQARFRAKHCPDSPWVFCHKNGKRVQDVKTSFNTACKRAGIEDFRIHDLRHTCAAWLVTAGVALAEVRDLLGHQSIQMTERYAHLAPENVRAAVTKLESNEPNESRFGHVEERR